MVQVCGSRVLRIERMVLALDVLVHLLSHRCQTLIIMRSLQLWRLRVVAIADSVHLRTLRFLQTPPVRSFYAILAHILRSFFCFLIGR